MKRLAIILALILLPSLGKATQNHCEDRSFEGYSYTLCTAKFGEDLRLFWGQNNRAFGHFYTLNSQLRLEGKELIFAMNAGMFAPDLSPVGHYVENGVTHKKVVTRGSSQNFGMLPNGIFCMTANGFHVFETLSFVDQSPDCIFASQSGPMLVIDGALHHRFLSYSTSRYIRNGVGVSNDNKAASFVISNQRINFHQFARIFQEDLNIRQALFFDGNTSRLYARDLRRKDFWPSRRTNHWFSKG